jgi:hypothetical protein
VVDIGASSVEELLGLMQRYRGSHEDFDCFVVPTVWAIKQQQDTIATLIALAQLGVPPSKALIVQTLDSRNKLALAQKLATRRLASGVVPELDASFAALELEPALA